MDRESTVPVEPRLGLQGGDAELVQVARHDPVAFGELYKLYLDPIYGYMRARVGNHEDAADLAEQVFLQAWKALPKYRDRGVPFSAWLFRIARNVATDSHRRARTTVRWESVPERLHPSDSEGPEDVALRREGSAQLRDLLAGLPSDKQELISLRFGAGLTLRQIGVVVGKSESTVHHHLGIALRILKEGYHEE